MNTRTYNYRYQREYPDNSVLLQSIKYFIAQILLKHPRFALYSAATTLMVALVFIFLPQTAPSLNAQADHVNSKYYTTIQVESGDTLWDIALEYRTVEYSSIQAYINEVKDINHIIGDEITSGCYLTIPYYAEEPMVSSLE